jgi:1-acyl-sn-glycerol-3-phosphate acyltransferase
MVARLFYIAPIWFYYVCKYGNSDRYTEEQRYHLLHGMMRRINRAGRVTIDAYGMDKLPKEEGYIMFPNHQGLFDTLALFESHEKPFSAVVKKEMEHVFLVKQIIKLIKAQLMDRDDVRQSLQVIKQVAEEVKAGRRYVIFAEGTRSRNGNELLEFKAGTFKSAMMAKCPIVPVALIDAFKAFDTNSIKKITVKIHYMEPILYEEYKNMKSTEIAAEVKRRIEEKIKECLEN